MLNGSERSTGVFDRIRRESDLGVRSGRGVRYAFRRRGGVLRRLCAGLAIFGLYVQLFAAGLCGSALAQSLAGPSAFPICHTPASGSPSDQAPAQDHRSCPFCAVHCKAAMVLPPSVGAPERFVAAATRIEPAHFLVPAPARFSISAPPRGPPASA
jgi:hypothetical protein